MLCLALTKHAVDSTDSNVLRVFPCRRSAVRISILVQRTGPVNDEALVTGLLADGSTKGTASLISEEFSPSSLSKRFT